VKVAWQTESIPTTVKSFGFKNFPPLPLRISTAPRNSLKLSKGLVADIHGDGRQRRELLVPSAFVNETTEWERKKVEDWHT
jgi:hypothetical protein